MQGDTNLVTLVIPVTWFTGSVASSSLNLHRDRISPGLFILKFTVWLWDSKYELFSYSQLRAYSSQLTAHNSQLITDHLSIMSQRKPMANIRRISSLSKRSWKASEAQQVKQ